MPNPRERSRVVLLVLAVIAPSVGLLGTIIGMMRAFDKVSEAEVVDPPNLAHAISQSIQWTGAGIAVGIVFLFAFIALGRRTQAPTDSISDE